MKTTMFLTFIIITLVVTTFIISCQQKVNEASESKLIAAETIEYFLFRPEVEKAYSYSHAVKIGNY